ncbi:type II secretion system F family protein [Candidatus Wolfebacteria bacterium]|nr:type II secretion system F family protein [Candidatus Wolfebacteria bacterium]
MRFHYLASKLDNAEAEGEIEGENLADVLKYLAREGLRPVSIKPLKEIKKIGRFSIFGQSITTTDKVFLTKYLALMIKAGTDLFKAIDILISDFEKADIKALLMEIRYGLEKGQPFYSVFAKYPKFFSPVFINLIKAGEASGNLEQVLSRLSVSLQKEADLRRKIKAALTYPIILLVVSSAILFILVSFALPKIADIFTSTGFNPPLFSKIVFTVGIFIGNHFLIIFGGILISVFFLWYFFSRTLVGRQFFYQMAIKIPVVGDVLKKIALQRFAGTFSSLLSAGMPILDSLEITADTVGFEEMKRSLIRISKEGIAKGLTIGDAFRRESVFPRTVTNLVAISEKAGHLEKILETLSDFYESEIESSVKSLVAFLEPAMLLIIGVIVATIALSTIIPIYQLMGQF